MVAPSGTNQAFGLWALASGMGHIGDAVSAKDVSATNNLIRNFDKNSFQLQLFFLFFFYMLTQDHKYMPNKNQLKTPRTITS